MSKYEPEPIKDFPVHEMIKVIDGITIAKSGRWWSAVLLVEWRGRTAICFYLWRKSNDQWKRKYKWQIRSEDEWAKIREAVESFMEKVGLHR